MVSFLTFLEVRSPAKLQRDLLKKIGIGAARGLLVDLAKLRRGRELDILLEHLSNLPSSFLVLCGAFVVSLLHVLEDTEEDDDDDDDEEWRKVCLEILTKHSCFGREGGREEEVKDGRQAGRLLSEEDGGGCHQGHALRREKGSGG